MVSVLLKHMDQGDQIRNTSQFMSGTWNIQCYILQNMVSGCSKDGVLVLYQWDEAENLLLNITVRWIVALSVSTADVGTTVKPKVVVQGIMPKLQMDCGVQWLVPITVQWRDSWLATHTEGTAAGHQAAFSIVTEFNIYSSASSFVFASTKKVLLQLVIHATNRLLTACLSTAMGCQSVFGYFPMEALYGYKNQDEEDRLDCEAHRTDQVACKVVYYFLLLEMYVVPMPERVPQ
jgi:hypothetical protein